MGFLAAENTPVFYRPKNEGFWSGRKVSYAGQTTISPQQC